MAKRTRSGEQGSPDLQPDPPLASLKTGGDGELVSIFGYLGDDPDDANSVRLYTTLNFDSYITIPRSAISHRERRSTDGDPLAGSVLWVNCDAELEVRRTSTQKVRADFLRGPINPAGPAALNDLPIGTGGAGLFSTLPCVTATIVITTTIITARSDSTNSSCCPSDGCSATSQCLCSGTPGC